MTGREKIPLLIEALVEEAETKGLHPNKTYIQKALYLCQEAFGIDLGIESFPYIYGPYSPDSALLTSLTEARGLISISFDPEGYGVRINSTEKGKALRKDLDGETAGRVTKLVEVFAKAHRKIKEILPEFSWSEAKLWELIASVHYIKKHDETNDPAKIRAALLRWKPHFKGADVEKVLDLLDLLDPLKEL